jgi:DNA-directed RNA polymerase subunit beta'
VVEVTQKERHSAGNRDQTWAKFIWLMRPEDVMDRDGTIVNAGEEVMPGLVADALRFVEYVETPEGAALLLRPVEEYPVPDEPSVPSQDSVADAESSIKLRAVQRIPFQRW